MNEASGNDGILVELFQILKEDAMKVLHSIWQQILKTINTNMLPFVYIFEHALSLVYTHKMAF